MQFQINKGIGKSVEFQGLKSQYIFILAGGLLGLFVLFVILAVAGVPNIIGIIIVALMAALLVWRVFDLNKKYGEHGLMKLQARGYHPRHITNRRSVHKIINYKL
ncbi:MAG: DUF4133 domain-containing protein [Rikenellaceae bacterium]